MKWVDQHTKPVNKEIAVAYKGSLILSSELEKRGMETLSSCESFLEPSHYQQASPFSFNGMEKAADRILRAIQEEELIGIWGDFDCDGQTSTAVLKDALSRLGAHTIYHIPIRKSESHGMQLQAFQAFLTKGPSLVITCDTGISDFESISFAKSKGIDVIITDHHVPPEKLPDAYAIINPHQLPSGHPLSYLAGVGAAFQVIRALSEKSNKGLDIENYYDLVALGTIADLAQLKAENRFYAQMGLKQMNNKLRISFASMFEVSQSKNKLITENTIGFNIAPRLNSSGRLGDANENVQFLLSANKAYCTGYAKVLEDLNNHRKLTVESTYHSALDVLNQNPSFKKGSIIILHKEGWNKGVLGIVAGKLSEFTSQPVVLLNLEDNIASGSARSIEGIDITQAIRENEQLLIRYGGHSMAAGLSINAENLPQFERQLKKSIEKQGFESLLEKPLLIDHHLTFSNIGNRLVDELLLLAPFGKGNDSPVFISTDTKLIDRKTFGLDDRHIRYVMRDASGDTAEIIRWNSDETAFPYEKFDIVYHIQPDEYRGKKDFMLEYIDHREHIPGSKMIDSITYQVTSEDFRNHPDPIEKLREILKCGNDLQIWYEGSGKPEQIPIVNRLQIKKTEDLAILTPPPSYPVLQELLDSSSANKIYLFAYNPSTDRLRTFLSNLSGIIKYYLNADKEYIDLKITAAQLCCTQDTILLGLSWLQAHGDIQFQLIDDGKIELINKHLFKNDAKLKIINKKLSNSLIETSAFRDYYLRAQPAHLLRNETK